MFPFNSNPFRLRLFQSQKLYNNLCKLYAIFLAWFKIHGFLEAKCIFSEKLILSSFKWDIALITSVNTVDKKNKRKKVTIICHFFKWIIAHRTTCLSTADNTQILRQNFNQQRFQLNPNPPFHTAGPISLKVARARSLKNKQTKMKKIHN